MKRFLAVLALVTLVAMPALAEDPAGCLKSKGMQRTVSNIDNGVKITMSCSDPKMVTEIQAKAAKGCGGECPMAAKGVTRTVENTPEGAVVTATSTDPAQVKAMQDHAAKGCTGEHAGMSGCKHGEAAKTGCNHGEAAKDGCKHGEAVKAGCAHGEAAKACDHGKEQAKEHACPMAETSGAAKS